MAAQDGIEGPEDRNAADQFVGDRQEEVEIRVSRLASICVEILEKFEEHIERGDREEADQKSRHSIIENSRFHSVLDQPSADHTDHVGIVVIE